LTPLHLLAEHNNYTGVKPLLDAGADIEALSHGGETPLSRAARADACDVVKKLLLRGASLATRHGALRETPLHVAISAGAMHSANVLLAAGASVHARDAEGATPLHRAVTHHRYEAR